MTAANWRSHPHAPWAFRNIASFLPVARIAGTGVDLPIGPPLPPLPPIAVTGNDGALLDLPALLRATHADGFLVLDRGRIVFESYAEGMTATTPHLSFSVTKALTGLLAEILIAQGLVDPATRTGNAVPELGRSAFAGATLRGLLDMVDGVGFDETYADPDAQIHRYSKHFWGDGGGGVLAALQALPVTPPVPGFAYRTPATDVAGLVIERMTGTTLDALLAAHIWGPAGAADAVWVRDTGGRVIASAGLACTLRDLARVGAWLLNNDSASLARARAAIAAGGDRRLFAAAGNETRPGFSYRSGWWIDHPAQAWNALGVFGQRLHLVPGEDIVIARFGSHPAASNAPTDLFHARLFAAIRAALRR
ncbi:serine hydrolase [Sandarakinorhabdus sp.]|uniref:serine hydrolase domain-containing protein n=1 Tax=Sandarakinorhabdus sp. TaxID=1916663 RepID=UPI00333EB814